MGVAGPATSHLCVLITVCSWFWRVGLCPERAGRERTPPPLTRVGLYTAPKSEL